YHGKIGQVARGSTGTFFLFQDEGQKPGLLFQRLEDGGHVGTEKGPAFQRQRKREVGGQVPEHGRGRGGFQGADRIGRIKTQESGDGWRGRLQSSPQGFFKERGRKFWRDPQGATDQILLGQCRHDRRFGSLSNFQRQDRQFVGHGRALRHPLLALKG